MCDRNEAFSTVLNNSGCKPLYDALSKCLEKHDRDWRQCQKELMAFRQCYELKKPPTSNMEAEKQAKNPSSTRSHHHRHPPKSK
mmetsp:Transcript_3687/g.4564  ORF Transcript_3687/g.4564 Transcript_3687/m.4564 type:complete len:84 (-) Transcript_3687:329-580(-)